MLFFNSAALIEFVGIEVNLLHESFAPKKRDKSSPGRSRLSQATEKFTRVAGAEASYRAVVTRETHAFIKTLVLPGVADKNRPLGHPSTCGGLRPPKGETETVRGLKRLWGDA